MNKKKNPDEIYYFSYGTNIDPMVMLQRGIKYQKRMAGILYGYGLRFNKIAKKGKNIGYASIVKSPTENIEGAFYIIDKEGLKKLDIYEGYPNHYDKYIGTIKTDLMGSVDAFVYVAQEEMTKEGLYPSKDYLSHILAGKDLFSKQYYNQLTKIKTLEDMKKI